MSAQIPSGHTAHGPQCHRCGTKYRENPWLQFRVRTHEESGILFYECTYRSPTHGETCPPHCCSNDYIEHSAAPGDWSAIGEHEALTSRPNAELLYWWCFPAVSRLDWRAMRS